MALTNRDRVGKAMDLLAAGLGPFVEREMKVSRGPMWAAAAKGDRGPSRKDVAPDPHALLGTMWDEWEPVFRRTLDRSHRTLVAELRDVRNRWAHGETFSTDDAYRALDSIARLLSAVSAPQAPDVEEQKQELLRIRFSEQARQEKRREASAAIEGTPSAGLRPWRELTTPHPDVQSGRYQQAEFAADLAQVYRGEGSDEYRDPKQFFQRTHVTEGILHLLVGALQRLAGTGGDPVVELQTSFGGGKTHSMLALYHLFSGVPAASLPGIEPVLKTAGVDQPQKATRAVLVGTALSPAQVRKKEDGTVTRTLWGELAWQVRGKKGYALVADADKAGVSPGSDILRQLLADAAPCLILIDEWIAYARQLFAVSDLPAGSFDANLSFAQALSEAARAVPKALVVATIPESDIEIGGEGGREALQRLQNTFGRMQASWRPASPEESFEIVRRRLFQPQEATKAPARDAVIKAFSAYYRDNAADFPQGCGEGTFERRMQESYPIHPELFDRLYNDWSTLARFQRTRGVLRLMAKVIHELWERQDAGLMILPANVPLDVGPVQFELTQYLDPTWVPVIEKDVDGPSSLPLVLDRENHNLGRYSATRRVARTVFIGSAATEGTAHRGIDDRRIKLGCAQPGETVATFGDALRRLTDRAVHLFVDGPRYWYSVQQNVLRTAQDRAAQLKPDQVDEEIRRRLRQEAGSRGDFDRVHPCPASAADVSDDPEVRLVVLDPEHPHTSNDWESLAARQAAEILDSRGTGPRTNRNAVVFLAADKPRLADVASAVRLFLAWQSVEEDQVPLNLDQFQMKQAKSKVRETDQTVSLRIPEAYRWLLVPSQPNPTGKIEWQQVSLQGQEGLAARASKKMRGEGSLQVVMGATNLRAELDKIPLWPTGSVRIRDLATYFPRYLYLPRLARPGVLAKSIESGLSLITWERESFAYAEGYDEAAGRYRGLRAGEIFQIDLEGDGLLVKPDIAARQRAADTATASETYASGVPPEGTQADGSGGQADATSTATEPAKLTRFHGSVHLDPTRLGRDAGKIAEEVVQHLSTLPGAKVELTLEIQATLPAGAPDAAVRTVTENCRTLKFKDSGFEEE